MKSRLFITVAFCTSLAHGQIDQLKRNADVGRQKLAGVVPTAKFDPTVFVNTFVGTGGHGHTFPGAVAPFGMVQLSPDTRKEGWDGCGGYHYSDSSLYGFSHTHLSGTGIPDYADLLVVPHVGTKKTALKYLLDEERIPFSHKDEKAAPGYYSVFLKNPDVQVRLTATPHAGMHEYRFGQSKGKKYLLLNLGYRDKVIDGTVGKKGSNVIEGARISMAWAEHQHFYFHLETSVSFTAASLKFDQKSKQYYAILEFPENTNVVTVKTGVSGTDIVHAKENLDFEISGWDFDAVMRSTRELWRKELGGISITGGTQQSTANFYTALYHAYVHPSVWSDVDGTYRNFNNKIDADSTMYSVFSIWDTYRAAHPLYTITQPERTYDFTNSFYRQFVCTGLLPMWTLSNNETDCMIGYHAASILADAMAKHLIIRNATELLDAMVKTSKADIYGRRPYGEQGFISADQNAESVSKTLEYAYDDWCIAQYAGQLQGKKDIAAEYELRSMNWRNLYYPESGFFQPRQNGIFLPNFRPNEVNHHYTEANAWQYSLAAPHDIRRLIDLKGGNKDMEDFLDTLFHGSSAMSGREQADITGLIGQYAHGNEPSHHVAYVYNYCGAAHKAQELLDRILKTEYRNAPDGLAGNEDCGQMSAWYVLSAMGFYPFAPGSPTYTIGRPLFSDVRIPNKHGKDFHIEAVNNSNDNKYIQLIHWNGKPYKKLYITHDMIVEGGDLQIVMGPEPKPEVDEYETDLHEQELPETEFMAPEHSRFLVSAPFFSSGSTAFADSLTVGIEKLPNETGRIVYSLEAVPDEQSTEFSHNLVLYNTTTVYARIYRKYDGREIGGPAVSYTFRKFDNSKSVALDPQPANQYSGSNASALVDGMFGGPDYRSVGWQGFEGSDVTATIQLQEKSQVSGVVVHALQDTKSWIFFPKSVTVEYSADGQTWKKAGKVLNKTVSDKKEGTVLGDLEIDFTPVEAKYIRVIVENYGACPSWHLGAGGKSWVFLDEITVK